MIDTKSMETRINYIGGKKADDRLIQRKTETLRKALLYSYQAETIELEDGRQFRCLINPDKETGDYDNKVISIPYTDICLNEEPGENGTKTQAMQEVGLKNGDVFRWVETDTHWISYLEYLEENSYYRAQIRRCDQTTVIDGKEYWVYIRGPVETSIPWNQKLKVEWNDMNHSLEMYVTKNESTVNWFKRFKRIKVKEEVTGVNRTWQIVACNPYFGDGIVKVSLDEYFENPIEEALQEEKEQKEKEKIAPDPNSIYIDGPDEIAPYTVALFKVMNLDDDGEWFLQYDDEREYSLKTTEKEVSIQILRKRGNFTIKYVTNSDTIEKKVKIVPI